MMMMMMIMMTILLILNLTYIGNSDWQREFSPYTKSCEVDRIPDMCSIYCIYQLQLKVCLVSKLLKRVAFSNFFKLREK